LLCVIWEGVRIRAFAEAEGTEAGAKALARRGKEGTLILFVTPDRKEAYLHGCDGSDCTG